MIAVRGVVALVALVLAYVVQAALLARLPLPGGPPDVVLLVVTALALVYGAGPGAMAGFAGGLLLDLASAHAAGQLALVLTLVGCGAGVLRDEVDRSTFAAVAVVAVAALVATAAAAGLGVLLGDPRVTWMVLGRRMPAAVGYDLLLAPFVVPMVAAAARRLRAAADR